MEKTYANDRRIPEADERDSAGDSSNVDGDSVVYVDKGVHASGGSVSPPDLGGDARM